MKRVFAITGFLLLFVGLSLGGYLFSSASQAQALDANEHPALAGGVCAHPQPKIELANRTMAENDSQALHVHFSNINNNVACLINVTIDAPNFDVGTLGAFRSITLPPNSTTAELVWVITPQKAGTFQIAVQSELDTDIVGITVLNVFGFSPWQIQIFSMLSTLFGPMLTVPWWYEQWKAQQSKKRR